MAKVNVPARLEIKLDGRSEFEAPSGPAVYLKEGGSVQYVRVERSLDAPDTFEFRVNVLRDSQLVAIDEDLEGKSVEIALAIGESPKTVFKGEVCYVEPYFSGVISESYLGVRGYDHLHRLTRGTNAKTWGDGFKPQDAYSEVASDVIGKSASQDPSRTSDSLSPAKVDSTAAKFAYVSQVNVSDYQFLRSLGMDAARPAATDSASDPRRVSFRKIDTSSDPVLFICRDKLEGDPAQLANRARFRLSTVNQYKAVVVRGWDPKQKKAIVGTAERAEQSFGGTAGHERTGKALYGKSSAGRVYQVTNHPVTSQDEADAVAQALFNRLAQDFVTGEVTTAGFPDVAPGHLIEMKGFGKRFGGKYLVVGVIHEVNRFDGYRTHLQVARNSAPDPD